MPEKQTMLAPELTVVSEDLAQGYDTFLKTDSFSYSATNTRIGSLSPDPDWLSSIRTDFRQLLAPANRWQETRPDIAVGILTPFTSHSSLMSAVSEMSAEIGNNKEAWRDILFKVENSLETAQASSRKAQDAFKAQIKKFTSVEVALSANIDKAWRQLETEVVNMTAIAHEVGVLNERVNNLTATLTPLDYLESNRPLVQTSITTAYTLISTAGTAAVPYLAIARLAFSVGKGLYDLVNNDLEISKSLKKIAKLRTKASQQAQAAAMSKAIIQLINDFDKALLAVGNALPNFDRIWAEQIKLVRLTASQLESGMAPMDIIALNPGQLQKDANTWQTIAERSSRLLEAPQVEKPVQLTT